jgi:hypothetical protein
MVGLDTGFFAALIKGDERAEGFWDELKRCPEIA